MRYVGETKNGDTVLCFFAAHYTPPPLYCGSSGTIIRAAATKRATVKSKEGIVLEKDLPLCDSCARMVAKNERELGNTVQIRKL